MNSIHTYLAKHWYKGLALILPFLSLYIHMNQISYTQNNKANSSVQLSTLLTFQPWDSLQTYRKSVLNDTTIRYNPILPQSTELPSKAAGSSKNRTAALNPNQIKTRSRYFLKGISGGTTALLVDLTGQTKLVESGDQVDSASVVQVTQETVLLKDAQGTFTLSLP